MKILPALCLALSAALPAVAGAQRLVSCCSNSAHAQGFYASTSLPRTEFKVTYGSRAIRLEARNVTIDLRHGCDAQSPQFGHGTWGWANGGVRVAFANGEIVGFPRQELDLPADVLGRCAI